MPTNHEWHSRIKAVEREYVVMRQAANHFRQAALGDPTILQDSVQPREINLADRNLEGTYVIRLFAEFETGARHYWGTNWDTDPKTVDLINGLAARCLVPDALRNTVHSVREYRNALVHEREDQLKAVPIAVARGYLCHFFSFLPRQW